MEQMQTNEQEFLIEIFNVSLEADDIEIKLGENFEASINDVSRRC